MGSTSDWDVMSDAAATLAQFGVEFEKRVVSAHRTPDLLVEYAKTAKSRGLEVIIAGAGGAAHLPGMVASMTALPADYWIFEEISASLAKQHQHFS